MTILWIRAETKLNEKRAPLAPQDVRRLIDAGIQVIVEQSADRAIPDDAYSQVGCQLVKTGSWPSAPDSAFILGVKELPDSDAPLIHRHIHFGHVFKDQPGWRQMLSRYRAGGGALYDLEFLTDGDGRRVAAFGYWAGYAGAALGALLWAGLADKNEPALGSVASVNGKQELVDRVAAALANRRPTALITGALGRCGRGATDFLESVGVSPTKWDLAETKSGGPFPEILQHDIFVNCVLASPSCPVFVPADAPALADRRLTAIADVSCDPGSNYNPIPIYDQTTTFDAPMIRIASSGSPLAVTAIDHLPSLLPQESTEDYSAQLVGALLTLGEPDQGVWARAHAEFAKHMARL